MAGRFPGAPDVDTFWSNLCDGVESIRPFSDDDLRAAGADTGDPAFVNAGAQMDGIEAFDAGFFGMNRREAELTDPQHRILLETAWATLENAGYDPADKDRRIGLFGKLELLAFQAEAVPDRPRRLACGRMAHPAALRTIARFPSCVPRPGVRPTAWQREVGRAIAEAYAVRDFDPETFVCIGSGTPTGYPRIEFEVDPHEWEAFEPVDRQRGRSAHHCLGP